MTKNGLTIIFWLSLLTKSNNVGAFPTTTKKTLNKNSYFATELQNKISTDDEKTLTRRSLFLNCVLSISLLSAPKVNAVDDDLTRGGVPLTPFNGLTFNYRGNYFGGLDASALDEPSISYAEFLERLSNDEVTFVEFLAPDGDKAYATLKPKDGEKPNPPIRIGEGYPVEDHGGWSSPAFVVKSVTKKGVPYKFTVPGLAAYK